MSPAVRGRLSGIDPTLYLVTDTGQSEAAGRSVAQTVRLAVEGGVGIVQVRDKHATDAQIEDLTRSVFAAVEDARATLGIESEIPLFVDDRLEAVVRLRAQGLPVHLHVGQDDTPVSVARQALGPEALIGLSASTIEEIRVGEETGAVDLFGIGAVWETGTKDVGRAPLEPQGVADVAASAQLPCVAIGGINDCNAHLLLGAPIVGICVVSAICAAADPRAAAQELRAAFSAQGEV